ncbi:FAD dependent oxidoreductase [Cadophora sp. MPI-SDFR-AT-0126]|nr:FAD dependent oxidoreductase [Leotiomycetes sp. MPI-SDFR-AT-0126]
MHEPPEVSSLLCIALHSMKLSRTIHSIIMASETAERNIVIVGGGIIGCTTAYFLTRHPSFNPTKHTITILEAQSIASGASGKAGGLLALWAYPSSIVPLSYKLHAELAKEHDGAKRWGYRAVHCGSLSAKGKDYSNEANANGSQDGAGGQDWQKLPKTNNNTSKVTKKGVPEALDWFDADCIKSYSEMGTPSTTAQVHPYQFTTSMADLAVSSGAKVILGSVTAIDYTGPRGVKSITYEDKDTKHIHTLPATDVILAAGPWTSHVFPEAPIEAVRAHSVVIEADVSPYAIFTEISLPKGFKGLGDGDGKRRHGSTVAPEMYARPDGTVYACGEADTLIPLPKSSSLVEVSPSHCTDIISYISSISPVLRHGKVLARQACYLPSVTGGGGPLIGETGIRGLLMATGHTCWGIQNSCATGKLMSEFVFEGAAKSARIETLDPRRFL